MKSPDFPQALDSAETVWKTQFELLGVHPGNRLGHGEIPRNTTGICGAIFIRNIIIGMYMGILCLHTYTIIILYDRHTWILGAFLKW